MALNIYFLKESPVKIWGMTSRRRMELVLRAAGAVRIAEDLEDLHEDDAVLILRADYLIDDRLLNYMAAAPNIILHIGKGTDATVVAAHVPASSAQRAIAVMEGAATADLSEVQHHTLETISVSFQEKLRKFDPPFVLRVSEEHQRALERRLFAWSYKGVTDLVTKWAWPIPARWAVGRCVRWGVRPNHVTLASLILVITAGVLFAFGHYGWGLLAGWMMTFLDTVDGKLARVTVTSSRFGHYFDHVLDLVHPPVWYILWGVGLYSHPFVWQYSLSRVLWLIMIGYVLGRLSEGLFQWYVARFGIFCWRPVDSYFRLVTARRNPNLILLTVSVLAGRPELGLVAVAFWTVLTSLVLLLRLMWAGYVKFTQGPLKSWLRDADSPRYRTSLSVRLFSRRTDS